MENAENVKESAEKGPKKVEFNTKLVCINYPGIVNDVDKMIETLGGMNEIESNINSRRKMLNLRFRPGDLYCKPTVSELDKKPGILVKITPKESQSGTEQEFDYDVIGITALSYSFNRLCDFQYLPLIAMEEENSESPLTYIYDQIVPNHVPDEGWLFDSKLDDMPHFLPPAVFSRYDNPLNQLYFSRSKFYEGRFKPEYTEMLRQQELERKNSRSIDQKMISKKSGHGGLFCSFRDINIPSAPPKLALQFLNLRYTDKGAYEKVKKLFEERPIWSRIAILHTSQVPNEHIKFILPAVAYYFRDGPWRIMWCKYGYDPRKDPSSRIYQTFDFRVRASAGLKAKVTTKKQYNLQRYRSASPANIAKISLNEIGLSTIENNPIDESSYMLKPNMIPAGRQMFYQYCDVHLPEIQTMLNKLPPVMPGAVCDYRNGWLPNKFTEQCREIANNYIIEHVQKIIQEENKRQVEEKEETGNASSTSKNTEEQKSQDLLEISDSESDSNSEYLPSDSADEDEDYSEIPPKTEKKKTKKKGATDNDDEEDDDDDEIDMDAVDHVNKLLKENYAVLKDFDRLVYDSD